MPLDVLGRTRATLTEPTSSSPWPEGLGNLVKLCRAGDRALQLLLFNEEFLVSASHQLVLITSLPFVHTVSEICLLQCRRQQLTSSIGPSLLPIEWLSEALGLAQRGRQRPLRAGNLVKLGHLEEVKVVTRFPLKGSFLEAFPHDDSNHTCAVRFHGRRHRPAGTSPPGEPAAEFHPEIRSTDYVVTVSLRALAGHGLMKI